MRRYEDLSGAEKAAFLETKVTLVNDQMVTIVDDRGLRLRPLYKNAEGMLVKDVGLRRKSVDESTGRVTAIVNTCSIDREGEIILTSGIRTANYMRNPVHIWGHKRKELDAVIGKCESLRSIPGGLEATFLYSLNTPSGRLAFDHISAGNLCAYSIGSFPIKSVGRPFEKTLTASQLAELRTVDLSKCYTIWTEVELWEISLCSVPANAEALIVGRAANGKEKR